MKPIVIFGDGPIAQLAHFYFTHDTGRHVAAFTVDARFLQSESFCGLPVVAFEHVPEQFAARDYDMFIALGYNKVNALRKQKFFEAKEKDYSLASYISSKATVWPGDIGENCFILEDNTIQPFARIGNNVTLWSGNHIGHHATIGDHCFLTSQVVVSGKTTVGEESFIGVNATLRDGIRIGRRNVIGAGALILKDTQDNEVYACTQTPLFPRKSDELEKL